MLYLFNKAKARKLYKLPSNYSKIKIHFDTQILLYTFYLLHFLDYSN